MLGIHTVGHSGGHDSSKAAAGAASGHSADAAMTDAGGSCDGTCGAVAPVAARPDRGSDPVPGGTGLVIMCLAVLSAVGVLALLAGALARRYGPDRGTAGPLPAPIWAMHDSLVAARLVDVAVLRI